MQLQERLQDNCENLTTMTSEGELCTSRSDDIRTVPANPEAPQWTFLPIHREHASGRHHLLESVDEANLRDSVERRLLLAAAETARQHYM